ncbi:MAG: hypothetical protein WBP15_00560, partial [Tabrizicola sp.]
RRTGKDRDKRSTKDRPSKMESIVEARKFLGLAFGGYGKQGKALFEALNLPLPDKKGKAA